MKYVTEKQVLPPYPRTMHLPWKPNTVRGDLIATEENCKVLFTEQSVVVEEKIDGAQCGMAYFDGHPIIRNRDHILSKGYHKQTPAKQQFKAVWNWFYDHRENFEALARMGHYSVYGEWMVAQHGLEYDRLPSWFIAYDLYDYDAGQYIDSVRAKIFLRACGFHVVPELHKGPLDSWPQLEGMANGPSPFTTTGQREGVYVKVSDGQWITKRFKMVREGFVQGGLWSETELHRNRLGGTQHDADTTGADHREAGEDHPAPAEVPGSGYGEQNPDGHECGHSGCGGMPDDRPPGPERD